MTRIITRLFDQRSDADHAVIELDHLGVSDRDVRVLSYRTAGETTTALDAAGVSSQMAGVYFEAVRRGAILVSAQVPDDKLSAAEGALSSAPFVDIYARAAVYRAGE